MKILKLNIHNIASIGDAEIDFSRSPLSESSLFLISGKTGSGKSTILDCICLALYDQTPRLNGAQNNDSVKDYNSDSSIPSNDTRQMLSKYAVEGVVELDFVGNNDVIYHAEWSVARAHRKLTGKIQAKRRLLTRKDINVSFTKINDIKREIAEAVNLDFNQFCRTVMLAQGEFTRFLNSKDDEKADILSKITGTQIYTTLGIRIFDKFRTEEAQLIQLKESTEKLELMTEQEVKEKTELLKSLTDDVNILTKSQENINEYLSYLESRAALTMEIESLSDGLELSTNKVKDFVGDIKGVEDKHGGLIDEIKVVSDKIKSYDKDKSLLDDSEEILAEIEKILSIDKILKDNDKSIGEKEILKKDKLLPESIKADEEKIRRTALCKTIEGMINDLKEQLAKIDLPKLRKEKEEVLESRINYENLHLTITALKHEQEKVGLDKIKHKNTVKKTEELRSRLESMQEPLIKSRLKVEICQELYDKLFSSDEDTLSKIRSVLKAGDICPVCRNKIEEALPTDSRIASLTLEHKNSLESARTEYDKLFREEAELKALIKAEEKTIENLRKAIEDNKNLRELHESLQKKGALIKAPEEYFTGEAPDLSGLMEFYKVNISGIENKFSKLKFDIENGEAVEQKLKKISKEYENASNELVMAVDAYNKTLVALATIDSEITMLKSQNREYSGSLKILEAHISDRLKDTGYVEFHSLPEVLKSRISNDITALANLRKDYEKMLMSKDNIESSLKALYSTQQSLRELLPAVTFDDVVIDNEKKISENELVLYGSSLLAEIKTNIQLKETACNKLRDVSDMLSKKRQIMGEEIVSIETCRDAILSIKTKIEQKNREIGATDTILHQNNEKITKLTRILDKIKEQEAVVEKWYKLKEIFGDAEGKKFRRIAQSYILSELIHSANHYLSGFTDRYRLSVVPGKFVIMVEDSWDDYAQRPAATISGGESFMVSLSLALALSDLNSDFSVDILFIDEGFGSLSAEYLQSAITTLRTLHRKSGKRIGIISHVEELRERIPVKILLESQPNSATSNVRIVC